MTVDAFPDATLKGFVSNQTPFDVKHYTIEPFMKNKKTKYQNYISV